MSNYLKVNFLLLFIFIYLNIYGQSYSELGDEALLRGDYKSTIENYLTAIKKGETGKEAYEIIGRCYFNLEDYTNAIKYLVQRLEIGFPHNALYEDIYEIIIASYLYLNKINEAKNILKRLKLLTKSLIQNILDSKKMVIDIYIHLV